MVMTHHRLHGIHIEVDHKENVSELFPEDIPRTSMSQHLVNLRDLLFNNMHTVPVNLSTKAYITPSVQPGSWLSSQELCGVYPRQQQQITVKQHTQLHT